MHYIRIVGHNFYSLPLWTNQTDRIPEANWFEYSLTNRIRGRTVSSEGTEADRLDLFKFVLASAYDMENQQLRQRRRRPHDPAEQDAEVSRRREL